jgi:hypothetical protein
MCTGCGFDFGAVDVPTALGVLAGASTAAARALARAGPTPDARICPDGWTAAEHVAHIADALDEAADALLPYDNHPSASHDRRRNVGGPVDLGTAALVVLHRAYAATRAGHGDVAGRAAAWAAHEVVHHLCCAGWDAP